LKKKRKKKSKPFLPFGPLGPLASRPARAPPPPSRARWQAGPGRQAVFLLPLAPFLSSTAVGHRRPHRPRLFPSFPFLLQLAIKSRNCRAPNSSETAFCFPFYVPPFLPVMPAATNGSRRHSGSSRLSSPPFLCCYLSTHSSSCTPLCTRSTPLHALEPNSTGAPPRVPAAAVVNSSPPVKDNLRRPSFFLFGSTRGSSNSGCCRFSSSGAVGAAPRPHRSTARLAAVAKLHHRRIPSFSSSPSSLSHGEH
jgi:hypothetical protein